MMNKTIYVLLMKLEILGGYSIYEIIVQAYGGSNYIYYYNCYHNRSIGNTA